MFDKAYLSQRSSDRSYLYYIGVKQEYQRRTTNHYLLTTYHANYHSVFVTIIGRLNSDVPVRKEKFNVTTHCSFPYTHHMKKNGSDRCQTQYLVCSERQFTSLRCRYTVIVKPFAFKIPRVKKNFHVSIRNGGRLDNTI